MSHLYIIQSDKTGAIKIGRSKNPSKRLKQLQTGCPDKLKLLVIFENKGHLEKNLHRRLKSYKSRRRGEWFDFDCAGDCGGSLVEDCAGDCGGTAQLDECGECAGNGGDIEKDNKYKVPMFDDVYHAVKFVIAQK